MSEARYRRELTHMLTDAPRPGTPATFTEGLKDPANGRVLENEWRGAFGKSL